MRNPDHPSAGRSVHLRGGVSIALVTRQARASHARDGRRSGLATTSRAVLAVVTAIAAMPTATAAADEVAFLQPSRQVRLAVGEPGLIAAVNVRRGDAVAAGDVVLTLDSSVLEAQRRMVQAQVEGTARLQALEVGRDRAARRVDRYRELATDGLGSDEELTDAIAAERVARLELRAAIEEHDRLALKRAELEARIAARRVVCPIDGVVIEIDREAGEVVTAADPLVAEVANLAVLRATFHVPTAAATRSQVGQGVAIAIPATGQAAHGRIEHIGLVTAADSGRVRVDVLIDNADRRYRSGLECTASF